jgi:hypothetical protein
MAWAIARVRARGLVRMQNVSLGCSHGHVPSEISTVSPFVVDKLVL